MNDKILDWAMKIKSISQIGLAYTKDPYDKERYQQLEEVATQMLETKLDMNNEKIYRTISHSGGASLALGIVVLVTGIVSGVLMIVTGAKLLKQKYQITF